MHVSRRGVVCHGRCQLRLGRDLQLARNIRRDVQCGHPSRGGARGGTRGGACGGLRVGGRGAVLRFSTGASAGLVRHAKEIVSGFSKWSFLTCVTVSIQHYYRDPSARSDDRSLKLCHEVLTRWDDIPLVSIHV